jgi:hypothetical protein
LFCEAKAWVTLMSWAAAKPAQASERARENFMMSWVYWRCPTKTVIRKDQRTRFEAPIDRVKDEKPELKSHVAQPVNEGVLPVLTKG